MLALRKSSRINHLNRSRFNHLPEFRITFIELYRTEFFSVDAELDPLRRYFKIVHLYLKFINDRKKMSTIVTQTISN